jgi:hypothetical protein
MPGCASHDAILEDEMQSSRVRLVVALASPRSLRCGREPPRVVTSPAPTREHAIVWHDGQLIDLGTLPGDTVSRAMGINDFGQVVGLSVKTDGVSRLVRAVLWDHGPAIELPFGEPCVATAINNKGHIAVRQVKHAASTTGETWSAAEASRRGRH